MKEAGLGSKYLVLPGKMLQIVICSIWGLSFSRHGSMTPWPLSAKPRCFAYHSCICCLFADLKKIPPMPRIRPCWLMDVFLSVNDLDLGRLVSALRLVIQPDRAK